MSINDKQITRPIVFQSTQLYYLSHFDLVLPTNPLVGEKFVTCMNNLAIFKRTEQGVIKSFN